MVIAVAAKSEIRPGCDLAAPCYHLVSDEVPLHVRHLYPCRSAAAFERELDWLLARYEPVGLEQILTWSASNASLPRKSLFLSFDDGFREMAEVVGPICKRRGVPCTFFLTTDFLDNRSLGYRHKASLLLEALSKLPEPRALAMTQETAHAQGVKCNLGVRDFILGIAHAQSSLLDELARLVGLDFTEYLRIEHPYMSSEQVHSLLKDGFSIGAHSLDHPLYSEIPLDEQYRQTRGSLVFIEERFQPKLRAFAFPFVSDGVSEQFYRRVFYERIVDVIFRIGGMPPNRGWPVVERFGVENRTNEPVWTIIDNIRRRRRRSRVSRMTSPIRRFFR